jgi:MFS family permease
MTGQMDDRPHVSPRNRDGSRGPRPTHGLHVGPLRITATLVMVAVAIVGSFAFLAYALTVREATQIPLLAAGLAVLGIVFGALAVSGLVATYRAGDEGRSMRALGLAILGGIASIISLLCFAGAILGALLSPR